MLIDPFTIFVQILNFVVLILILKRFLFGPITGAIAAREQKIANALDEAKANNEQAQLKLQEMETRTAELATMETTMLHEAKSRAKEVEAQMISTAKAAAKEQQEQLRLAIDKEKTHRLDELQRELAGHVYRATDQAMHELAGYTLQERIEECFIEKMEHEINQMQEEFAGIFGKGASIEVATPSPMNLKNKTRLQNLLQEKFGFQKTLLFTEQQDLLAGIEIRSNGRKIDWTMEKYLKDLKKGLAHQEHAA